MKIGCLFGNNIDLNGGFFTVELFGSDKKLVNLILPSNDLELFY